MAVIKFGTDGWRAIIGEDFTFDNVRLCAQGVANYLMDTGQAEKGLVIGYDTRFASEDFAVAAAEVVAGNGIRTYLCRSATPTPVISYSIILRGAAGAIVITSSHNPPSWNGVKYKPEYAGSASPQVLAALEEQIVRLQMSGEVRRRKLHEAVEAGLVEQFDPTPGYLRHLADLIELSPLREAGLKVVVDSMYGAGRGYFKRILADGKTRISEIHRARNPLFPGIHAPEPIARNLGPLMRAVRQHRADVGLATDGDSDRLGLVDEKGNYVNQLQVFALLALYLLEVRGWRGPIVKTVSTTSMIDRLGQLYHVPVYETAVGFKYVGPAMMEHDAIIGGEESGGYGFRHHIPERDAIVAGLYLLDFMVKLGKTPSQLVEHLFSQVGPHYYNRIDAHFPAAERPELMKRLEEARPEAIDGVPVEKMLALDGYKYILADGSWLLVRFSGTEPLMRIYTETDNLARVERILQAGRELVGV